MKNASEILLFLFGLAWAALMFWLIGSANTPAEQEAVRNMLFLMP